MPHLSSSSIVNMIFVLVICSTGCYTLISFHGFFTGDNHVFPFLLAVEKMMNNGSVSRDEWQLFTRLPSNALVDRPRDGDVEKPHWVSDQVQKVKTCTCLLQCDFRISIQLGKCI